MKKGILFIGLFFCFACNQPTGQTTQELKPQPTKLALFFNSFLKAHPHINENDIYNEKAQVDFKKQAISFIADSGGLSSIKLEVVSAQKNPNGKGYITHFKNTTSYDNKIIEHVHVDVFALSDEKTAIKYNKNTNYIIKNYKKTKYLESDMIKYLTGDFVWTDKAKIDAREYNQDYSFGNYVVEL
jgi:hypothetical protein